MLHKCTNFFEGYNNVSSMLDFFVKGIEKLSQIERKWSPSKIELNRLYEVTKKDPYAPTQIKHTIDLLDAVSKNLAYINQEKLSKMPICFSSRDIMICWLIPTSAGQIIYGYYLHILTIKEITMT